MGSTVFPTNRAGSPDRFQHHGPNLTLLIAGVPISEPVQVSIVQKENCNGAHFNYRSTCSYFPLLVDEQLNTILSWLMVLEVLSL